MIVKKRAMEKSNFKKDAASGKSFGTTNLVVKRLKTGFIMAFLILSIETCSHTHRIYALGGIYRVICWNGIFSNIASRNFAIFNKMSILDKAHLIEEFYLRHKNY